MRYIWVTIKAFSLLGAALLIVAIPFWCWLMVPWTPQGCWQVIARAEGKQGEEYAVAQEYKGWIGDFYSVRFYYRKGHVGPWREYWLAHDDPYWRPQLLVDSMTGGVTVQQWGEAVAVFDSSSETLKHWLHPQPFTKFEQVDNPQTCPPD